MIVPEPAIDLFADLAVEHNPGVQVMVQHSWGDAATSAIMLAVLRLRSAVVAGEVPGATRQSELFRDPLGHASQPTMDAVTYAWFAALYEQSPVGLTSLQDPEAADSAACQRVLQELAWAAEREEPMALV
ncbi:MAG TPA: hypothetical protein VM143_09080 [Acidimicrobiales bacterium]|nr:hypothetical protein [Acidimicrobiales bacterium]